MGISMSHRKARLKRREAGFALLEVMIAIVILAVGLLGLAALLAQLTGSTTQSRYLGAEVMLASEKMEDLNQRSANDPALTAGGDLVGGTAAYTDSVQLSSTNGFVGDKSLLSNNTQANGAATNDLLIFKRSWKIEANTPMANVRRITVIVMPQTGSPVEKAETFQSSMVRPCDPNSGC